MILRILLTFIIPVIFITYTESKFLGDPDAEAFCNTSRSALSRINRPRNMSFLARLVRHNTVCLASFLRRTHLLTSAYCATRFGTIRDLVAYVGPTIQESDKILVDLMVLHPQYVYDKPKHDLAVVRLERAPFLHNTRPCFTRDCYEFKRGRNDYLLVGAWQKFSSEPRDTNYIKNCMLSDEECGKKMKDGYEISEWFDVCINNIHPQDSICDTNLGGPLLLKTEGSGVFQQVGVVSSAKYCKDGAVVVSKTCGKNHANFIIRIAWHYIKESDVVIKV